MKTKAYLYIILGGVLWGLIGVFVKVLAAQGFTPTQIVALRVFTAALCMTAVLLHAGRHNFKFQWRDIWMFIGTGVVSFTFSNSCYFSCIELSSLAVAVLLLYTAPIFVMLMSVVLFGERFTLAIGIALVTTFLGCAFVTGAFDSVASVSFAGLLYGLGSGFGYAMYSVFSKFAMRRYSTLTITAYALYFATLSSVPLANFPGSVGVWDSTTIWAILGLAVISTVLPYLLYTRGLESVEAGQASILATVEPLVAATVGVLLFSEPLTFSKIFGMSLIFVAVVLLNLQGKSQKDNVSRETSTF